MYHIHCINFESKEDLEDFIEHNKNHCISVAFNIVKKYNPEISVDDLFHKKEFSRYNEPLYNSYKKYFPIYDYTEDEINWLKTIYIKSVKNCYASIFSGELYDYIVDKQVYVPNPMALKEKPVLSKDSSSLEAFNFVWSTIVMSSPKNDIRDFLNQIKEKVPSFDVKKEILKYYEHFPNFYISYTKNDGDIFNFYTLCCNFKIPSYMFLQRIKKHKGCPNCGIKYCFKDKKGDIISMLLDIKDFFDPKDCSICKEADAYVFYVENRDRKYSCSNCIRKVGLRKNDEIVVLENTCVMERERAFYPFIGNFLSILNEDTD